MSQTELQALLDYAKSVFYKVASTVYSEGWKISQDYVIPTVRSVSSTHPDIASLFVLLITLYISLRVLNTASRWMYSIVMSIVRMVIFGVLVLGAVWMVKVGQGEDASKTVTDGVQWAMDKGRQYVWNAAGELFNRR